jgi:hypothetical protein
VKQILETVGRFFAALERTERGTYTILLGLLGLAVGITAEWYVIPSSFLTRIDGDGAISFVNVEPVAANVLRLATFLIGVLLGVTLWFDERHRFVVRWPVWALLAAYLSFPCWLNQWRYEFALDSARLNNSVDRVISQMDYSYDQQQMGYRQWQVLIPVGFHSACTTCSAGNISTGKTSERLDDVQLPIEDGLDLTFFKFSRQEDVLTNVLGYSNAFFLLAGKGWYLGAVGCVVALIGLYLPRPARRAAMRRDLPLVALGALTVALAIFAPRAVAEYDMVFGDYAAARGDNLAAIEYYRDAVVWKPVLKSEISYYAVIGKILRQQFCDLCPESLLSKAYDDMLAFNFERSKLG